LCICQSIIHIDDAIEPQKLTDLLLETAQEYGGIPGEHVIDGAEVDVLSPFYYARPGTIYGGSSEIQRNILAKYVLKLPS